MLKIVYGPMKEAVFNTSMYFDNSYLGSWFEDDFAKKMIRSIDRAEVVGPQAVESKALGVIPVTRLSGGLKTLLLMYNKPELIYNASTCGDNCAKWILRIAKKLPDDLTINLRHIMDFGNGKFDIIILNDGSEVHSMAELVLKAGRFLDGERA